MIALAKGRLGEGVGDALGDFIDDLKGSYDERLEIRLATMADAAVVHDLVGLVAEVAGALNHQPIALALDDVNLLGEQDFALLLDIMGTLPDGVRIRGAFASDRGGDAQLLVVESDGGVVVNVPPLTTAEIYQLLIEAGLDPALSGSVLNATGGVPIAVQDAIQELRSGGDPARLGINAKLLARTKEVWRVLGHNARRAAAVLAAYPVTLDDAAAADALDVSAAEWGETKAGTARYGGLRAVSRWTQLVP